ncbi:MAG: sigma-70 family RNA polymerase sigma factor [Actinomycetota bacterium]|nr:sigma-70 family RNA polymerase sigma factor [Actinomycetota bacterium]
MLGAYRERGDRRALERLFSMHGPLLKSIARRYRHSSGEHYEDLLQVGHVGLMKAVNGYEAGSAAKFSSYAHSMMEGELRHYLRDSSLVKKPRWARSLYAKVSHATAELMVELGRPPLAEEIAKEVQRRGRGDPRVDEALSPHERQIPRRGTRRRSRPLGYKESGA